MSLLEEFFEYACERYRIKLNRDEGLKWPWTDDPVLRSYRFCHIFREDDKTTTWFRVHIRDPLRGQPLKVALATAAFRMFNRIEVGERLSKMLLGPGWRADMARKALAGVSPIVTGAYMVRTPYGKNKLEGICEMMWELVSSKVLRRLKGKTLEEAHALIESVPYQGHFTAYEIVTDLYHTCVLEDAPDAMTWANPGPGAARGLKWIYGDERTSRTQQILRMQELLALSQFGSFHWPEGWPDWDMRTVEHTLCEFDKYKRGQAGSRLKRRYEY